MYKEESINYIIMLTFIGYNGYLVRNNYLNNNMCVNLNYGIKLLNFFEKIVGTFVGICW